MSTKKIAIIFGVVAVLIAVTLYVLLSSVKNNPPTSEQTSNNPSTSVSPVQGNNSPTSSTGLNHAAITPIIAPFVEITVDEAGFSPSQTNLKKGGLVHFINQTSETVEIVPTGNQKIVIAPIEVGKTGISLPIFDTGTYNFALKENSNIKGTIIVE